MRSEKENIEVKRLSKEGNERRQLGWGSEVMSDCGSEAGEEGEGEGSGVRE